MTPDPTLIEQVARAIFEQQFPDSEWPNSAARAESWREMARAAIAAYEATRQGSAALPSEVERWLNQLIEVADCHDPKTPDALIAATKLRAAMRATTPTAPIQDTGAPCGTGSRASHEASISVESSPKASIPNADDGESYRMTPQFKRFLATIGSVDRAMAAWDIAVEAFAPLTPEADFEVWQGDEMVAGCSGPRGRAIAEAVHYAVVYQTDGQPCVIQEVTRREVSPDVAHSMIASAIEAGTAKTGTGLVHESAAPQEDAQNG